MYYYAVSYKLYVGFNENLYLPHNDKINTKILKINLTRT